MKIKPSSVPIELSSAGFGMRPVSFVINVVPEIRLEVKAKLTSGTS